MSVSLIVTTTCVAKPGVARHPPRASKWRWALVALLVAACVTAAPAHAYQLDQIRRDVRTPPEPQSEPAPSEDDEDDDESDHEHHHHHRSYGSWYDDDDDGEVALSGLALLFGGYLFVAGVTSPYWYPREALGDDPNVLDAYPSFPYDGVPGYMVIDRREKWRVEQDDVATLEEKGLLPEYLQRDYWHEADPDAEEVPIYKTEEFWRPDRRKRWACRLRADYADTFDDLRSIGGHMLLSTASRFEVDTGAHYLREDLPDGGRDHLCLGDCNVVYRFAQSERAVFRSGIGFNWLADREDADFGFNFTYGADIFPREPWVLSATLDWGTLGRAELFHFRTTAGVMVHRVESFVGYEYYDIDATQTNALIAGVRLWF